MKTTEGLDDGQPFRLAKCAVSCETSPEQQEALRGAMTQRNVSLHELSNDLPQLVIFLRHLGCVFCRETLLDIARLRKSIELEGAGIVLVHMSEEPRAREIFAEYGLGDISYVTDTDQKMYEAFQLRKGRLREILGPRVLGRLVMGLFRGYGFGEVMGDYYQMPGVFLIHQGRILQDFRHRHAAERPNYVELAEYPVSIQERIEG